MKLLDVVEDIYAGLGTSQVLTPIHTLALEHAEEACAVALSAQLPTALMLQMRW